MVFGCANYASFYTLPPLPFSANATARSPVGLIARPSGKWSMGERRRVEGSRVRQREGRLEPAPVALGLRVENSAPYRGAIDQFLKFLCGYTFSLDSHVT